MEPLSPHELYQRYCSAMARVTVANREGDLLSAAAFHIGGGYLVTARHVVDHLDIKEIVAERGMGQSLEIRKVILSSDPKVDLAVIETDFNRGLLYQKSHVIPIGMHMDDWIDDGLTMTNILLMGYPRIPFAAGMPLVAVAGQVSAVLDRYDIRRVHFVISTLARGGFSGGPVISEYDFLLGVATESLMVHESIPETGFTAVLSTEGLWEILFDNHLLPPGVNGESMVEYLSSFLEDWPESERTLQPEEP